MNDCLNRGYVLDAFPRNYLNCNKLFKVKGEDEDAGGDDEDDGSGGSLDPKISPDSAIFLKQTHETSLQEIYKMDKKSTVGTHYNELDLKRRYKIWSDNNITEDGSNVLIDFFIENSIGYSECDISNLSICAIKSMKIFIERNGKYNNYQSYDEQEEQERLRNYGEKYAAKDKANRVLTIFREETEHDQILIQQEEMR